MRLKRLTREQKRKIELRIACPEAGYPYVEARYGDINEYESYTGQTFFVPSGRVIQLNRKAKWRSLLNTPRAQSVVAGIILAFIVMAVVSALGAIITYGLPILLQWLHK